jgi:hypothetical protein
VKGLSLTAVMLAFISTAQAQGYVVQSPGHRPVYALPRGNGTYVMTPRGNRDIGRYTRSHAAMAGMAFPDKGLLI